MDTIQKTVDQELDKIPNLILKKIIEKKLRSVNINPTPKLVNKIINHALTGDSSSFKWNDRKSSQADITISISEEDSKEAETMMSQLMDSLPDIFDKTSTDIAKSVLKSLKQKWTEEHFFQVNDSNNFRTNLEKRWGKALSKLRMLLTIARELSSEINEFRAQENSHLNNVLQRLHVRACQVTAEIITLLENGFADGAMARWRTLHEIGIVITLMNEHGESLAERYIAHRAIEAKNGKDQYMQCYEQIGYDPLTTSECREVDEDYESAIKTYGKEFSGPYGWAEEHVTRAGTRRLGLGDLEAAAGRSAMASHYKLASYNVHAGPHALFYRLGLIDIDDEALLAGASNAGLMEPGQNTAFTFTLISVMFVGDNVNMDILVTIKLLMLLRDEIPDAFNKADQKLQAAHIKYSNKTKNQTRKQ